MSEFRDSENCSDIPVDLSRTRVSALPSMIDQPQALAAGRASGALLLSLWRLHLKQETLSEPSLPTVG